MLVAASSAVSLPAGDGGEALTGEAELAASFSPFVPRQAAEAMIASLPPGSRRSMPDS